jgi:hypothetical protein
MNAINGGSFAVTAARKTSRRLANDTVIEWLLGQEERMAWAPYARSASSRIASSVTAPT